jgi:aryl-alcohol dehydrogenase-like predicted oxidoreductase
MKLKLMLGTAQWGWTLDKQAAFALLDAWLKAGYSEIDAATNYPINKQPSDFRASERILAEYISAHGLQGQLSILMKVGSMDNMRTPAINLSPSFLRMMTDEYQRIFGENLGGIMIHWDNREEPENAVETVAFLHELSMRGIRPGLSGIKYPEHYAAATASHNFDLDIEVKHNVLVSDLARYQGLLSGDTQHRVWAYGISAGGVKLRGGYTPESTFSVRGGDSTFFDEQCAQLERMVSEWNLAFVRPPLLSMHHLGLLWASSHPQIHGAVIGPKNTAQMAETVDFLRNLDAFDYSDVVKGLSKWKGSKQEG